MSHRIPRPEFIRPSEYERTQILGGCLHVCPAIEVDLLCDEHTFANTTLRVLVECPIHPHGKPLDEVTFPLVNAAETNKEQTQLAVDTAKICVESLCRQCEKNIIH